RTFENVLPPLPAGAYKLYAEVTHENGLSQTLTADLPLSAPFGRRTPELMAAANMLNEVICQSFIVPLTNALQPSALDADDSWHINPAVQPASVAAGSPLMGGGRMVFQQAGELVEN